MYLSPFGSNDTRSGWLTFGSGAGGGVGSTGVCGVSCRVLSVSLIYRYYTLDKAVVEDTIGLDKIV